MVSRINIGKTVFGHNIERGGFMSLFSFFRNNDYDNDKTKKDKSNKDKSNKDKSKKVKSKKVKSDKDKLFNEFDINEVYNNMTLEEALAKSKSNDTIVSQLMDVVKVPDSDKDVLTIAHESNELMREMQRRLEEAKWEYDSVTVYLTDIQKIDALSLDKKAEIDDAARKIINLNKERDKHQRNEKNVNDIQFQFIRQYEDILPKEIVKMEEHEKYQQLVKNDLKHLEGERGAIIYEKESAIEKREFIKKFSVIISILVLTVFILLFLLNDAIKTNLNVPFFLAGVMSLVAIAYIVVGLRNAAAVYKFSEIKMNKLISLVNKVKIKYVNSTNILDYMYDKYHVNSYRELSYLWEQYVEAKDEAKRYQHNTELLEMYNNVLIEELQNNEIQDAEVWIYQPEALLDDREMVEVRHRLNVRRQKLRERIEFNNNKIELCKAELAGLRKRYPEYDEAISGIIHL